MMNGWFFAAGSFSVLTVLVHIVAGGRYVARPLLDCDELAKLSKYINYYCWHMVSLTIIMMAVAFFYCGVEEGEKALAVMQTALAGSFTLWSLLLIVWKKLKPFHMLQWILFAPVTICGVIGLC